MNVLGPAPDDHGVDDLVLSLAVESVEASAPSMASGAQARLAVAISIPADLAAMRSIKAALDPLGLLNPGVLFE